MVVRCPLLLLFPQVYMLLHVLSRETVSIIDRLDTIKDPISHRMTVVYYSVLGAPIRSFDTNLQTLPFPAYLSGTRPLDDFQSAKLLSDILMSVLPSDCPGPQP